MKYLAIFIAFTLCTAMNLKRRRPDQDPPPATKLRRYHREYNIVFLNPIQQLLTNGGISDIQGYDENQVVDAIHLGIFLGIADHSGLVGSLSGIPKAQILRKLIQQGIQLSASEYGFFVNEAPVGVICSSQRNLDYFQSDDLIKDLVMFAERKQTNLFKLLLGKFSMNDLESYQKVLQALRDDEYYCTLFIEYFQGYLQYFSQETSHLLRNFTSISSSLPNLPRQTLIHLISVGNSPAAEFAFNVMMQLYPTDLVFVEVAIRYLLPQKDSRLVQVLQMTVEFAKMDLPLTDIIVYLDMEQQHQVLERFLPLANPLDLMEIDPYALLGISFQTAVILNSIDSNTEVKMLAKCVCDPDSNFQVIAENEFLWSLVPKLSNPLEFFILVDPHIEKAADIFKSVQNDEFYEIMFAFYFDEGMPDDSDIQAFILNVSFGTNFFEVLTSRYDFDILEFAENGEVYQHYENILKFLINRATDLEDLVELAEFAPQRFLSSPYYKTALRYMYETPNIFYGIKSIHGIDLDPVTACCVLSEILVAGSDNDNDLILELASKCSEYEDLEDILMRRLNAMHSKNECAANKLLNLFPEKLGSSQIQKIANKFSSAEIFKLSLTLDIIEKTNDFPLGFHYAVFEFLDDIGTRESINLLREVYYRNEEVILRYMIWDRAEDKHCARMVPFLFRFDRNLGEAAVYYYIARRFKLTLGAILHFIDVPISNIIKDMIQWQWDCEAHARFIEHFDEFDKIEYTDIMNLVLSSETNYDFYRLREGFDYFALIGRTFDRNMTNVQKLLKRIDLEDFEFPVVPERDSRKVLKILYSRGYWEEVKQIPVIGSVLLANKGDDINAVAAGIREQNVLHLQDSDLDPLPLAVLIHSGMPLDNNDFGLESLTRLRFVVGLNDQEAAWKYSLIDKLTYIAQAREYRKSMESFPVQLIDDQYSRIVSMYYNLNFETWNKPFQMESGSESEYINTLFPIMLNYFFNRKIFDRKIIVNEKDWYKFIGLWIGKALEFNVVVSNEIKTIFNDLNQEAHSMLRSGIEIAFPPSFVLTNAEILKLLTDTQVLPLDFETLLVASDEVRASNEFKWLQEILSDASLKLKMQVFKLLTGLDRWVDPTMRVQVFVEEGNEFPEVDGLNLTLYKSINRDHIFYSLNVALSR